MGGSACLSGGVVFSGTGDAPEEVVSCKGLAFGLQPKAVQVTARIFFQEVLVRIAQLDQFDSLFETAGRDQFEEFEQDFPYEFFTRVGKGPGSHLGLAKHFSGDIFFRDNAYSYRAVVIVWFARIFLHFRRMGYFENGRILDRSQMW